MSDLRPLFTAALGTERGKNAASWCTDGNTTEATYRTILQGIEDGDPAILDRFNVPNLSGEWADEATPATLADALDCDPEDDAWGEIVDDVCQAWETAASEAFWHEVERVCRKMVQS